MSEDLTILGKFKSVEALIDAYDNLQREFTKKCQKLSQLSKNSENCPTTDNEQQTLDAENVESFVGQPVDEAAFRAVEKGDFLADVSERFLSDLPSEIVGDGQSDNPTQKSVEPPEASNPFLSGDTEFVAKYVLNNSQLMDKLLILYAQQLTRQPVPTVIGTNGIFGATPQRKPSSVEEAGRLADKLFK